MNSDAELQRHKGIATHRDRDPNPQIYRHTHTHIEPETQRYMDPMTQRVILAETKIHRHTETQ